MKKLLLSFAVLALGALSANAQSWGTYGASNQSSYNNTNSSVRYQSGYVRSDGTFVNGHMKTNRNYTNHDNFSTSSNLNPYTGTTGSRARDYSPQSYNYGGGNTIYTGSRGGQYYINRNGNKTYVPKRSRW